MLSKIIKFILIFSLSTVLFGCSLDSKTGIWNDKKKSKKNNAKLVKLSDNQDIFSNEFDSKLKINLKSHYKKNKNWAMSGLNHSNLTSHFLLSKKIKNFTKYKFKKIQHGKIKENPLVVGKNYFITVGREGVILKFVNKRKIAWSRNIYTKKEKKKIETLSFAVFGNELYVIDNLGIYYALNIDSGKIVWIKRHKAAFNSVIKVSKNKIFAVDSNNIINCFSTVDGKKIWKFDTNPTFIKTNKKLSIIVNSNSVIFTNTAGDVAKIESNTGELIWFMPTQNTLVKHETNFLETSDLVLSKKNLFFSNNFSNFFSLDLNTGLIQWILNINSTLRPVIIDNYIFTISNEGYLIVLNSSDGKIIRSNYILGGFKEKIKKKLSFQGFLIASNKIFITTNLGYLIICSVNTGKVIKMTKLSKSQLSEPLISNNNLYILTNESVLVAN